MLRRRFGGLHEVRMVLLHIGDLRPDYDVGAIQSCSVCESNSESGQRSAQQQRVSLDGEGDGLRIHGSDQLERITNSYERGVCQSPDVKNLRGQSQERPVPIPSR
jgi:hypothetical protein